MRHSLQNASLKQGRGAAPVMKVLLAFVLLSASLAVCGLGSPVERPLARQEATLLILPEVQQDHRARLECRQVLDRRKIATSSAEALLQLRRLPGLSVTLPARLDLLNDTDLLTRLVRIFTEEFLPACC